MSSRVTLEPAFVLHKRNYSDTSAILELFTLNHGRIALMARGVRSQRSKSKSLITPFAHLLVSWSGKSELPTLSKIEPNGAACFLANNYLPHGMYLNELLIRLLQKNDPQPQIYQSYQQTLVNLTHTDANDQLMLRMFEKQLLTDIGYGIQFNYATDGELVESNAHYTFKFGNGFTKSIDSPDHPNIFSGSSLLALHHNQLTNATEYRDAKRLMRQILDTVLGNRPIKSRELFFR